jgi:hypothetical protein
MFIGTVIAVVVASTLLVLLLRDWKPKESSESAE